MCARVCVCIYITDNIIEFMCKWMEGGSMCIWISISHKTSKET